MQNVTQIQPATEPDPIPLTGRPPTTLFPVFCLPGPIAAMVEALAEATQTDPAMAGTSALSVMAAAAGGRAEIEGRPGWREILALQTATIARPGERKSAVQAAMIRPLLDVEQELALAGAAARLEAETSQQIAIKAAEGARNAAGRATQPDDRRSKEAEAIAAAQRAEAITVPAIPRIVADDITPEAAGSLLADQGGRLAIISAEGGLFDTIAGRYSSGVPGLDVYLKGHAGDPIKVDRRGRPPEYVRRPAVTVGLMIQPAVLEGLGANTSFRGRGLLARFLYARPVSKVGHRVIGAPVPPETEAAYGDAIRSLVQQLAPLGTDPPILRLSHGATTGLAELEGRIEPLLAEDGALGALADWGSKYVGAVLRIAALLHLAGLTPDAATRAPVPAETFTRAAAIGAYYLEQAVAAFSEMATDQGTADAVYLLARLGKHPEQVISSREIQRLARKFKTRDDLAAPIRRLEDAGWLSLIEVEQHQGTGRTPGPFYRIHPATPGHEST